MAALFRVIHSRTPPQLLTSSPLRPNIDLTPFDRTDQVRARGVRVFGLHSDIKEVEFEGGLCFAKVPRFIGDQSNLDSFSAFEERVVQEAKIHASLSHPNILAFLGFAQGLGPSLALLSPWIPGGSAPTFLQENPTTNRLPLVTGIAQGLSYLHDRRIVHGDIKGANILVSVIGSDIIPLICDFGSAHVIGTAFTTASMGTYRYMARELLSAEFEGEDGAPPAVPTPESDVWSYGMTVLELFTDNKPYHDIEYYFRVIRRIYEGGLPSYPGSHARACGFTPDLWNLLLTCWVDPALRPTASTLVTRLSEFRSS